MIKIIFKAVGQGDSIILEWTVGATRHIGIIDCNLFQGTNPVLEYLKLLPKDYVIDFILLSHFHLDHFSGMSELFKYCISEDIKVKYFYHTIIPSIGDVYQRIFTSKALERNVQEFFESFEELGELIDDYVPVHYHVAPVVLDSNTSLRFLSPVGSMYHKLTKQLARKSNSITTTSADINALATILLIEKNSESIILTSDATKKSFKRLKNTITSNAVLIQAPHHGSFPNIYPDFWKSVAISKNCPAVFSVGFPPKDKLPNKASVEFFDQSGYEVHSTSNCFGITEYFGLLTAAPTPHPRSRLLDTFSSLKHKTGSVQPKSKFTGDQVFQLL